MRYFFILFSLSSFFSFSQNGIVKGLVLNSSNNQPIELAKVQIVDKQLGAVTNENGEFQISNIPPGVYSFKATASGYKEQIINEITVTNSRTVTLEFELEDLVLNKEEIVITAKQFVSKSESPNSLKTLNATEIERLPGAGRDVSKVIAALPGVASRATFRNDKKVLIGFVPVVGKIKRIS